MIAASKPAGIATLFFAMLAFGSIDYANGQELPDEIASRMLSGPRGEEQASGAAASGTFRPRPSGPRGGLAGPGMSLRALTAANRDTPLTRPVFTFNLPESESARVSRLGRQQLETRQQLLAQRARTALQQRQPQNRNIAPHVLTFRSGIDRAPSETPPLESATGVRSRTLETMLQRAVGARAADVQVSLRGETAVLTGSVISNDHAELIARILRMEPGVYEIENRLAAAVE